MNLFYFWWCLLTAPKFLLKETREDYRRILREARKKSQGAWAEYRRYGREIRATKKAARKMEKVRCGAILAVEVPRLRDKMSNARYLAKHPLGHTPGFPETREVVDFDTENRSASKWVPTTQRQRAQYKTRHLERTKILEKGKVVYTHYEYTRSGSEANQERKLVAFSGSFFLFARDRRSVFPDRYDFVTNSPDQMDASELAVVAAAN